MRKIDEIIVHCTATKAGQSFDVEDVRRWHLQRNFRDIGYHFPDTAGEFKNIDSKILLRRTVALLADNGFSVGNVDITVCAERPKLSPHIDAMRECLAPLLGIPVSRVSVKATTTEQLGFTGRREGISAYAVALIEEQG